WLAAGFAAVAAYGSWGLADRALTARRRVEPSEPANDSSSDFAAEPAPEQITVDAPGKAFQDGGDIAFLRMLRGLFAAGGSLAALAAVIGFMTAALQGLSLPGR